MEHVHFTFIYFTVLLALRCIRRLSLDKSPLISTDSSWIFDASEGPPDMDCSGFLGKLEAKLG